MVRGVGFFGNLVIQGRPETWRRGVRGDGAVGTAGCRVCTRVPGGGYVGKRRVPEKGQAGVGKAEVRLH